MSFIQKESNTVQSPTRIELPSVCITTRSTRAPIVIAAQQSLEHPATLHHSAHDLEIHHNLASAHDLENPGNLEIPHNRTEAHGDKRLTALSVGIRSQKAMVNLDHHQ